MNTSARPLPTPTDLTLPYWEAARHGQLFVQQCRHCTKHQFYPRSFCMHCMSEALDWVEASGKGQIYTYTVNRRGANSYMAEHTPYVVAIIELEEGVRLMANIIDSRLEDLAISKPVQVVFEKVNDEITLPQFKLVGSV